MRIAMFALLLPTVAYADVPDSLLVSAAAHANYLRFIPESKDPWLKSLPAQKLVFYDEQTMPPCYQHGGGAHDPRYNISANHAEPVGNPNREFPWKTGGLDASGNGNAIKFAIFPKGGRITVWSQTLAGEGAPVTVWSYPADTVFGEILLGKDADGASWPFEVRRRVKGQEYGEWTNTVYRPFADRADLVATVKRLDPAWQDNAKLAAWVNREAIDTDRLQDGNHPTARAFEQAALVDDLPDMSAELVRRILSQPFVEVKTSYVEGDQGSRGYGPTTGAGFGVTARDFQGPFLRTDSQGCMGCHDTVLDHANKFAFGRDWYGRVRGSDKIFSFHPFAPESISHNGFSFRPRLRQRFLDAGLLRRAD